MYFVKKITFGENSSYQSSAIIDHTCKSREIALFLLEESVKSFVKDECGRGIAEQIKILNIDNITQINEPLIDSMLLYRVKDDPDRILVYQKKTVITKQKSWTWSDIESTKQTFGLVYYFELEEYTRINSNIQANPNLAASVILESTSTTSQAKIPITGIEMVKMGTSKIHVPKPMTIAPICNLLDELKKSPRFMNAAKKSSTSRLYTKATVITSRTTKTKDSESSNVDKTTFVMRSRNDSMPICRNVPQPPNLGLKPRLGLPKKELDSPKKITEYDTGNNIEKIVTETIENDMEKIVSKIVVSLSTIPETDSMSSSENLSMNNSENLIDSGPVADNNCGGWCSEPIELPPLNECPSDNSEEINKLADKCLNDIKETNAQQDLGTKGIIAELSISEPVTAASLNSFHKSAIHKTAIGGLQKIKVISEMPIVITEEPMPLLEGVNDDDPISDCVAAIDNDDEDGPMPVLVSCESNVDDDDDDDDDDDEDDEDGPMPCLVPYESIIKKNQEELDRVIESIQDQETCADRKNLDNVGFLSPTDVVIHEIKEI